jgi:hypothetical protein
VASADRLMSIVPPYLFSAFLLASEDFRG